MSENKIARPATLPPYRTKEYAIWLSPEEMDQVAREAWKKQAAPMALYCAIGFIALYAAAPVLKAAVIGSLLKQLAALWLASGPLAVFAIADVTDIRTCFKRSQFLEKLGWWLGPFNVAIMPVLSAQIKAVQYAELGEHVEAQKTLATVFWNSHSHTFTDPLIETTMANIYARGNNFDAAEKLVARRYEAANKNWFSAHFTKALTATNMGWICTLQGNFRDSLRYSEQALAYVEQVPFGGKTGKALKVEILINLGRTLVRVGRYEEAEQRLDQAWELASRLDRRARLNKAETQLGYAELRMMQNRPDEALLHAQSSTECYMNEVGPGVYNRDYALRIHALILHELGREADAQKLEMQAEFDAHHMSESNEARLAEMRLHLLRG